MLSAVRRLCRRKCTSSANLWNVSGSLAEALCRIGVVSPTSVQAEAIPLALNGHDLLVVSQTGSGKTLMFMLPVLHRLTHTNATALILAPTEALAEQHVAVAKELAAHLVEPPDARLLITTPEAWLVRRGSPEFSMVAIDEVDACLFDSEHVDELSEAGRSLLARLEPVAEQRSPQDLRSISAGSPQDLRGISAGSPQDLRGISAASPRRSPPQYLLATAHLSDAHAAGLRRRFPAAVRVPKPSVNGARAALVPTLRQVFHYYRGDKDTKLLQLLQREMAQPEWLEGTVVVFCKCAATAASVHASLMRAIPMCAPLLLHEQLAVEDRTQALREFGGAESARLLVCSTAVARGLDLPSVVHVVLHDTPTNTAAYIHCVGRTARRGRHGRVSCLVESREHAARYRHLHALQPAERLEFKT